MNLWEPLEIANGTGRRVLLGPLSLWLRHEKDEWWMAVERTPEAPAGETSIDETEPPDDISWERWVVTGESPVAHLTPVMPDRPVVVRPESPMGIHHNSKALFFVSIPVWLRIHVGTNKALKLCEIPTAALSNIWFGDPMSGELGYSLCTRARRDLDTKPTQPHCAVCPVTLHNGSTEDLNFERLCIRVAHLRVYQGARQMWANGVKVSFRGEEQASEVTYDEQSPQWEKVGAPLSEPRQAQTRNLLQRSFGNVRSFAGI